MKSILILGAGLMQEPAIDAAHQLGYNVTVFDGNNNAYCKAKCEHFENLDLKYTDLLVKRAFELHSKDPFAAVFTAGTDFSFAVASIAKACNLPAHSVEAAKNASDKIVMRSCFEQAGVPSPKFFEVSKTTSLESINTFVASVSYPLVVKPCDNMGARGCRLARDEQELNESIKDAIMYSKTGRAIVEEYMEGPEFSIDALVCNGEVTITGFADRHIFYPPYFIEMGHSIPTNIEKDNYEKLVKTFVKGIHSLGLTHGAAKADIKLTKTGPMVGEIAARLSGGYMSGWTYPYASTLYLTKEGLRIALNTTPVDLNKSRIKLFDNVNGLVVYDYQCNAHSVERAWISIPGVIESVQLAKNDKVKNIFTRLLKGETAQFPVNNVEKAGNVICTGSTRKEAEDIAESFIKETILHLEKNNENTVAFLQQPLETDFPPSAFMLPDSVYAKIKSLPDILVQTEVFIPEILSGYVHVQDWNNRTLQETVNIVNDYLKTNQIKNQRVHTRSNLPNFWTCLIRGGIQGALFYFL